MIKDKNFESGLYEKQSWLLRKKIKLLCLDKIKERGWFIAGGACRSVFTSEKINDIDIFFVNELAMEKFKNEFEFLHKALPIFETDAAMSYSVEGERIQLIKKIYGVAESIISCFDFSIVQCCYDFDSDAFIMSSIFLYDNAQKKLRYNINIPYPVFPVASLVRSIKYIRKGYSFSGVEALKLSLVINNLEIKNYKDLKEQLDGIDTLLLKDVTDALLEDPNKEYDLKQFLILAEEKLGRIWDNTDD